MDQLSKICIVFILCLFLLGCASRTATVKGPSMALPERPAPVIMYGKDSKYKKKDLEKFPDAEWIKEPNLDPKKQRGWWDYTDMGKISEALSKWEFWYYDVKELNEGRNDLAEGKGKYERRPWYRPW